MYRTDTKINTSKSDYKIFTNKIYDKLVQNIDKFNEISKVTFIYNIEKDFENDMIHINFDYFGKSKPNGLALQVLTKLCEFPCKLYFIHFFYDSENKRKEYLLKPEVKQKHNYRQKEYNKNPKNKEKIKNYREKYLKKYFSKEENKEKRKEYLKNMKINQKEKHINQNIKK